MLPLLHPLLRRPLSSLTTSENLWLPFALANIESQGWAAARAAAVNRTRARLMIRAHRTLYWRNQLREAAWIIVAHRESVWPASVYPLNVRTRQMPLRRSANFPGVSLWRTDCRLGWTKALRNSMSHCARLQRLRMATRLSDCRLRRHPETTDLKEWVSYTPE